MYKITGIIYIYHENTVHVNIVFRIKYMYVILTVSFCWSLVRSPGGTPVRPRPPLRDTPPVTPVNQDDSIYRYWLNSLHNKFRNVLSPASVPESPGSDPNSPGGFSPQ